MHPVALAGRLFYQPAVAEGEGIGIHHDSADFSSRLTVHRVQNALINIVTIFLGLSVGAKLVADKFLQPQTLGILVLGVIAFWVGTAAGVACSAGTKSTR